MAATLSSIDLKLDSLSADMVDVKDRLRRLELTSAETITTLRNLPPHVSPCKHEHPEIDELKKRADKNDLVAATLGAIPGVGAIILNFLK